MRTRQTLILVRSDTHTHTHTHIQEELAETRLEVCRRGLASAASVSQSDELTTALAAEYHAAQHAAAVQQRAAKMELGGTAHGWSSAARAAFTDELAVAEKSLAVTRMAVHKASAAAVPPAMSTGPVNELKQALTNELEAIERT
jgi:hypothetical protein